MTKKDIVRTISEEVGLTQQQTKAIVQKTFDAIIETLVEDGRIELRNFGVFEVRHRAARRARNPRTGNQVEVPRNVLSPLSRQANGIASPPLGSCEFAQYSEP